MSATPILQAAVDGILAVDGAADPGAPAGCVLGVEIDGVRSVVAGGRVAAAPGAAAMGRATVHDLASVSKVLGTTTALHRLASAGLLDLDTPVAAFVPSFGGAASSTVRELLQHRAGLWEWQPFYLAPGADPFAALDSVPLRAAPGTERRYSDLGFLTLGRVVEAAAGAPLDRAVQELVAAPLGLRGLGYGPVAAGADVSTSSIGDAAERRMVATGQPYPVLWPDPAGAAAGFRWRTEAITGTANDGNCFHAFGGVAGHAGLFAPLDEMLDVAVALGAADEEPELWHPAVTAEFFSAGPDAGQALGWRLAELEAGGETLPLLWHPGFTGTAVGFVPGRRIAVAVAANRLLAAEPRPTDFYWQRATDALAAILDTQE